MYLNSKNYTTVCLDWVNIFLHLQSEGGRGSLYSNTVCIVIHQYCMSYDWQCDLHGGDLGSRPVLPLFTLLSLIGQSWQVFLLKSTVHLVMLWERSLVKAHAHWFVVAHGHRCEKKALYFTSMLYNGLEKTLTSEMFFLTKENCITNQIWYCSMNRFRSTFTACCTIGMEQNANIRIWRMVNYLRSPGLIVITGAHMLSIKMCVT